MGRHSGVALHAEGHAAAAAPEDGADDDGLVLRLLLVPAVLPGHDGGGRVDDALLAVEPGPEVLALRPPYGVRTREGDHIGVVEPLGGEAGDEVGDAK